MLLLFALINQTVSAPPPSLGGSSMFNNPSGLAPMESMGGQYGSNPGYPPMAKRMRNDLPPYGNIAMGGGQPPLRTLRSPVSWLRSLII